MRIRFKRSIALCIQEKPHLKHLNAEIRLYPHFDEWETRLFIGEALCSRRFRAASPSLALGKMLIWVKRKFQSVEVIRTGLIGADNLIEHT